MILAEALCVRWTAASLNHTSSTGLRFFHLRLSQCVTIEIDDAGRPLLVVTTTEASPSPMTAAQLTTPLSLTGFAKAPKGAKLPAIKSGHTPTPLLVMAVAESPALQRLFTTRI